MFYAHEWVLTPMYNIYFIWMCVALGLGTLFNASNGGSSTANGLSTPGQSKAPQKSPVNALPHRQRPSFSMSAYINNTTKNMIEWNFTCFSPPSSELFFFSASLWLPCFSCSSRFYSVWACVCVAFLCFFQQFTLLFAVAELIGRVCLCMYLPKNEIKLANFCWCVCVCVYKI